MKSRAPENGQGGDETFAGLAGLRIDYDRGDLLESRLRESPLAQFEAWWQEIRASGQLEPHAMVLATADAAGGVSARTVLLKGVAADGFRFFTNHRSRKARAIADNPTVSLLFPWLVRHRQVTVIGTAERLPAAESADYFRSRPRESQWAAWASEQSAPIKDRAALEHRMAELNDRWPEGADIPVPEFWGGYLVRAESVEFWQGRPSRLHDRLRYEALRPAAALDDAGAWRIQRYSP